MTINLHLPQQNVGLRPTITVIGVGGAGGNAVNNMINARLEGVEFVVANTDAQALESALTDRKIQLGLGITKGLGAGADPQVGRAAAEEAVEEIVNYMEGSNMVFITAGMGGGTGTGAAPVVARAARELGILTVGVVTKPFQFEGGNRMNMAESGLKELQDYVDTLIVIPNQNLFRLATDKTTFADAFRMADEVLHSGVRGVTDLMVKPGLVNLDFADIRTVMREMGKAMMGTGEASGEKRAVEAAEAAISNPLLDDVSLKGARAALINITGGGDMTLFEVDEAANRIREEIDSDANIIFGSTFSDELEGIMRVSVVATGIESEADSRGQGDDQAHQQRRPGSKRPFSYLPPAGMQQSNQQRRAMAAAQPKPQASVAEHTTPDAPAEEESAPGYTMMEEAPAIDTMTKERAVKAEPETVEMPTQEEDGAQEETVTPPPAVKEAPAPAVAQEEEAGPLFGSVSPRQSRPSRPAEKQQEAEMDDDEVPSFGFLNKIAEVKRALSTKAPDGPVVQPQLRTAQVEQKRAPMRTMPEQTVEEDNLEIPAFLRRQAN